MNERLTQLTESVCRRLNLISSAEKRIKELRRCTLGEALVAADELAEMKPLVKAEGLDWVPYLKEKFGDERAPQDLLYLRKHKHLLESHRAKNPDLSRRNALVIIRKIRRTEKKRDLHATNTQAIVAALKSVYMATTKQDECEQSSCFIFKEGRVLAYSDGHYAIDHCPLGECVRGAIKARPLLGLLRKLSSEDIAFSEVDGRLVVTSNGRESRFNIEKTLILPQNQWITSPTDWHKLPDNFAAAVKYVAPKTRTDKRDFYSSCVHIHADHLASGDTQQDHRYEITINVRNPVIVRGDSLRRAIKRGVTEFSVSDGWVHFRNEKGTLISCAIVNPQQDRERQTKPAAATKPIMPNPTRRLMIDSGAFTVWTQGKEVDLDKYIQFCESRPDSSFYVNLDVIPGKPRDPRSLTPEAIESACKQGWDNYQRMIERLPREKVIPVFHQGDSIRWLEKYLSAGVEYIGISPANDKPTTGGEDRVTFSHRPAFAKSRRAWLRQIKPYLFDKAGRPIVKTHGFAVTTFKLLKEMEWYSVDSSSWKLAGNNGGVYLPRTKNGEWDFTQDARVVTVSRRLDGYASLGSDTKDKLHRWLDELGVEVGSCKIEEVEDDYKPKIGEQWFNEREGQVIVPIVAGVVSSTSERLRVNAEFMRRAAIALKDNVKEIYFAGAPMPYDPEFDLGNRLLSFLQIQTPAAIKSYVEPHEQLIRSNRKQMEPENKEPKGTKSQDTEQTSLKVFKPA